MGKLGLSYTVGGSECLAEGEVALGYGVGLGVCVGG